MRCWWRQEMRLVSFQFTSSFSLYSTYFSVYLSQSPSVCPLPINLFNRKDECLRFSQFSIHVHILKNAFHNIFCRFFAESYNKIKSRPHKQGCCWWIGFPPPNFCLPATQGFPNPALGFWVKWGKLFIIDWTLHLNKKIPDDSTWFESFMKYHSNCSITTTAVLLMITTTLDDNDITWF